MRGVGCQQGFSQVPCCRFDGSKKTDGFLLMARRKADNPSCVLTHSTCQLALDVSAPAPTANVRAQANNVAVAARLGTRIALPWVDANATKGGPSSCPTANAAVIAAISRVGGPCALRRASWNPTKVTTTKVAPTHRADTTIAATLDDKAGASTPATMITRLQTQTVRAGSLLKRRVTSTVEAAAATPKNGQAQPKTKGSATSERASAGRRSLE